MREGYLRITTGAIVAHVHVAGGDGGGGLRRFAELVRSLPIATAMLDRELRYCAHNEAWLDDHGLRGQELIGHDFFGSMPELAGALRPIFLRCLEGHAAQRAVEVHGGSAGRRAEQVHWSLTPWRNDDGSVAGLFVYGSPTGHEQQIKQRLREREEFIRALFERSPIGMNLCRMDGLWLESNPAFLEIIGYTREEADGGLTYWQLTPRRYDADEAEQLRSLQTTGRYGPYEKEFIRKDGRLIPVRLNGFLIDREGEQYIWSLIEDITVRKKLEAELEAERLKAIQSSKLATLGEMAAGFAHEINNPLSIIDGYAFVLGDLLRGGSTEEGLQAIEAIRAATQRAGIIVSGLRKFARDPSALPLEDKAIDALVREALDLVQSRLRNHGVELRVTFETNATVRCRPIELSQVIINLLNNAFDAVVHAPRKWISLSVTSPEPQRIEVRVTDSGPPISPDWADKMFEPFFTTKKVGEGTGLGLSISRAIIESLGGALHYEPSEGHTSFVARVPKAGAP